jgi:hypothetical protein
MGASTSAFASHSGGDIQVEERRSSLETNRNNHSLRHRTNALQQMRHELERDIHTSFTIMAKGLHRERSRDSSLEQMQPRKLQSE